MQRNDHSCWPLFGRDDVSALGVGAAGVRLNPSSSIQFDPLGFVGGGGVVICCPSQQKQPLELS